MHPLAAQEYVGQAMALHVRPSGQIPAPGSPLSRTLDIIEHIFRRCSSSACIPQRGIPLVTYLGADNSPEPLPSTAASSAASPAAQPVRSDSARPQQGDPPSPPDLSHNHHSSAGSPAPAPLPPRAAAPRQLPGSSKAAPRQPRAEQPSARGGLAGAQLSGFDISEEEAQPAREAVRAAEALGLYLYRTNRWDAEAERMHSTAGVAN
jgi:hypothetical protein